MTNKKMKEYLKGGLNYGFKADDLKQDLVNQGMDREDVDSVAKSVIKERYLKRRNNVLVLSAVLVVFVLVMAYSFSGLTGIENTVGAVIREPEPQEEQFIDTDKEALHIEVKSETNLIEKGSD